MMDYSLNETWKEVPDTNGYFLINQYGMVKSIDRVIDSSYTLKTGKRVNRKILVKGQTIEPTLCRAGYLKVRVNIDGIKRSFSIHRVVATLFCNNEDNLEIVDHIDEDKTNNVFSNLRWVSVSTNNKRRKRSSLLQRAAPAYKGEILAICCTTGEIKEILKGNADMKDKGFDPRNVSAVLHGKRNSHRGCTFERISNKRKKRRELDTFTKSNFIPLKVLDKEDLEVDTISSYEDLINKGFIFQKVQRVMYGLEVAHRGFKFKPIKEKKL